MQILYLLVLGDKSNVLYGKDLCFNANYRFTHEIIDGDEDKVKVSWEIKDILPDNFFYLKKYENCCIDNVSEIIGINGSGKTLILKTLFNIETKQIKGKYILIYKKDEQLIGRSIFLTENGNKRIYERAFTKVDNCFFPFETNNMKQIAINQYGLEAETDLVYLCNHYCFSWDNLNIYNQPRVFDYSTAGLINSDFNKSEINHNGNNRICINAHRYIEMERIINLLDYLQKKNSGKTLDEGNVDDYDDIVNNIIIKNVNIRYNEDVIVIAHDAALKFSKHFNQLKDSMKKESLKNDSDDISNISLLTKIANQYSNMSSALAIEKIPVQGGFFFKIFWSFIASCVAEHINNVEGLDKALSAHLNPNVNSYCSLANRIKYEVKKGREIYDFKDEILKKLFGKKLNEIHKINKLQFIDVEQNLHYDFQKQDESKQKILDQHHFFIELSQQLQQKKALENNDSNEKNDSLELDFSDNQSKKTLYTIIELYFKINNSYPFIEIKFQPPISSGELSFLTLLGRLYDYLEKIKKIEQHAVIFIDEAETTLHPELQKKLCKSTISFVEDYCEYKEQEENTKRDLHLHIIFASHSPMLMSDVPTGNVIFLDKDNSSDDLNNTDWKTFAGDVFEIYQKGFFLKKGSIGNFAVLKIHEVIEHIAQDKITDDDRKIIDMIGDGLISGYFNKIIENRISSTNTQQK